MERPVHLERERRLQAQGQTAEWRRITKLSQREMAARVGVGHSTYRMWESGKESYAGPSRPQAQQLDKALRVLIGDQYIAGRALEVWGWQADQDIAYPRAMELLHKAGFLVPADHTNPPSWMFLVHRLREPNLLHGIYALAAATASRAGVSVRVILDDGVTSSSGRSSLRAEFESALTKWFTFAGGNESKLSIGTYSEILTEPVLAQQGWAALGRYLTARTGVLEFLRASKAISPLQYDADADQSVLELVRQPESLRADRLITPIRNWIVFESELTRLVDGDSHSNPASIVTLGGEDERILWDIWHRGCAEVLSGKVEHIFLQPVPMPSYRVPWQESALTARTRRPWLSTYVRNRMNHDGNTDLIEWMLRAAVGLPAGLNAGFQASLPPILSDHDRLLRGSAEELSSAVPVIAEAVVNWLNP